MRFSLFKKSRVQSQPAKKIERPVFHKTILAISDLHDREDIPRLESQPDLVLCLGDIHHYDLEDIDEYYSCPKFGVLGNHDAPDSFKGTSIVNMHSKIVEIEGITIAGFGGCLRYNTKNHGQYTEEECAFFLNSIGHVDIFMAHGNPRYELESRDVSHAGFQSFNDYIIRTQPTYFFHGHIHKQQTVEFGNTKIFSVYPHSKITV